MSSRLTMLDRYDWAEADTTQLIGIVVRLTTPLKIALTRIPSALTRS